MVVRQRALGSEESGSDGVLSLGTSFSAAADELRNSRAYMINVR